MFFPFGLRGNPVLICGHRGHSAGAPENTLAAINATKAHGGHICEIDVQLTADDVPVVIHDRLLDRTTSLQGPVGGVLWSELAKADAGSWFDARFRGERVLRLDETIEHCRKIEMGLMIELKEDFDRKQVLESLLLCELRRCNAFEDAIVSSFDHVSLNRMRRHEPRLRTMGITHARHCGIAQLAQIASLHFVSIEFEAFALEDAHSLHANGVGVACSIPQSSFSLVRTVTRGDEVLCAIRSGYVQMLTCDDTQWATRFASGDLSKSYA